MTSDRALGSAVAGKTSKTFNNTNMLFSPFDPNTRILMLTAGSYLDEPIHDGKGEDAMNKAIVATTALLMPISPDGQPAMPAWAKSQETFAAKIEKHLNAKGELDKAGLINFVAENVNDDPRSKTTTPEARQVNLASMMLEKYGISDDKDKTLATTLAKGAVIGRDNISDWWEKTGKAEFEKEERARSATTAPAAPAPH